MPKLPLRTTSSTSPYWLAAAMNRVTSASLLVSSTTKASVASARTWAPADATAALSAVSWLAGTRSFIADVHEAVKAGVAAGKDLNAVYKDTMARLTPKYGHWVIFQHCMPFDVTRCFDEVTQYPDPRIWTAERDVQMWKALEQ